MSDKKQCAYFDICLNNHSCYRCQNMDLLKQRTFSSGFKAKKKMPWQRFEAKVAKKLKETIQCRLQTASGAKWYAPGDIITDDILTECKSHPISATGAKQHTIRRQELQKIAEEAALSGRIPLYAFHFKDDSIIYVVLRFDDLEVIMQGGK